MADERPDFFVSYTGRDEAWAKWVTLQLERAGYRGLLQSWDFGSGNIVAEMEAAIQTPWILPILSQAYLQSKWGTREWAAYVSTHEDKIIPVQIEDIETRSFLRSLRRISLIGLKEADATVKLLGDIGSLVGQPRHDALERNAAPFPGLAARISTDPSGVDAPSDPPRRTIPISRDRVQLVVLGAGAARRGAVESFRELIHVRPDRYLDLFDSKLSANRQLDELAKLLDDLDAHDVSDVLVVVAGEGSGHPDAGVRLHVRDTDLGQPGSSIGLTDVLERLRRAERLRTYVILDATDAGGDPVGPTQATPVPVLKFRHGSMGGLARIKQALAEPLVSLSSKLAHWGPLSLTDLAALADAEVLPADLSPASDIGLVPNPLAWPERAGPELSNWCWVASATDERRPDADRLGLIVGKLKSQHLVDFNKAYRRNNSEVELLPEPGVLKADEVLASPVSLARAVEQVCRAELAIFDLTNFEPAVMLLLGIRAVIRRGITVCMAGTHDPPWQDAEPPFHLREISLLSQPDRQRAKSRILAGINQLNQPGGGYSDLPCFDLVRRLPPEPERRKIRPFDAGPEPTILALVPFEPAYVQRNWSELQDNLSGAAHAEIQARRDTAGEAPEPVLVRTLDLDSPRVVSAQLFEAMRLTDFCLVDLTGARPNVLFELGVRLTANRLHPVVVIDNEYQVRDHERAWLQSVTPQMNQLQRLLLPVEYLPYSPTGLGAYDQMVARHLEFRRLDEEPPGHPRTGTVLAGLPPTGVYELAWRHAMVSHEPAAEPVQRRLEAEAEAKGLLVDQRSGRRQLVYPKEHTLTHAAERSGREYLVAAWLYLHFRVEAAGHPDKETSQHYQKLGVDLMRLLEETGEEADMSFADRIDDWMYTTGNGGPDAQGEERLG